jgi:hypothetical protein
MSRYIYAAEKLDREASALVASNIEPRLISGPVVAMRQAAKILRENDAVIRDHVDTTSGLLADLLKATLGHR